MESTPLSFMKPTALTIKHFPTHLAPHPQTPPPWEKTRPLTCAGASKKMVIIKAVQAMESPEKVSMAVELEKELEEERYWEWREMEKCKGCGQRGGMVELMECLEREAMMGEDEGKDPIDYNRRAQIFDKSSKIFQALKQPQHHTSHVPSS